MNQEKRRGIIVKLGIVAALTGVLGIMSGIAIDSRPFKKGGERVVEEKIADLVPFTLKRPMNILILGIDNSGPGPKKQFLPAYSFTGNSDTMLLVRISPKEGIKILSIPRDTRVRLPGGGIAKINAANIRGGVPLAISTVSQLLQGERIDRYVRLNTAGLISLVDALGGVEIDVPKAMKYTDKTQNLYIDFQPGKQVLKGRKLQEYVRFRDRVGDIGRVQRQQQVLQVLKRSLLHPITLLKIPQLYSVTQQYLDTDLSIGEILASAYLGTKNEQQNLKTILLPGSSSGSQYLSSYWLPDYEKINLLLKDFNTDSQSVQKWSIAVANSTKTPKIAAKTVAFLKNQGWQGAYVIRYRNKPNFYNVTQIIVSPADLAKAESLKQLLGVGEIKTSSPENPKAQITLIIGQDWRELPIY